MSEIVAEDGYVIGSLKHLQLLRLLAQERTERARQPFNEEDYIWRLGAKVIQNIELSTEYIMAEFPDRPRTLFGIVVELDYRNPYNVQLWENITNKI